MKKLEYLFIIILFAQSIFGQSTDYPIGAYKNFSELNIQQPSIPFDFIIQKRTQSDIKFNGGSDYKIINANQELKR